MQNQTWHIVKTSNKLEQIYNKYSTLMIKLAYQIVKDIDSANDVLHDSIMKIAKNIDKIQDVESAKTKSYVLTITYHTAIDLYNQRKKENIVQLEAVDYELTDDYNLEEHVECKQTKEYIQKMLAKLKPSYSEVLTLKYLHEFSDSEISAILKISPALVRKRLERARKSMKKLMLGSDSNA